ncbi:MAG: hypothetical protein CSA76_00715, partial [Spirochaetales bacterium]
MNRSAHHKLNAGRKYALAGVYNLGVRVLILLSVVLCQSGVSNAAWHSDWRGHAQLLHGVSEDALSTGRADNVHLYVETALSNESSRLFAAVDIGHYRYTPEQSGIEVKEAYWSWLGENADLSIGRQIIPWGKADGLTVTDRISPKDLRQWLGMEYQDTRLGVDAVKFRYLRDQSTVELIWLPLPRFDALPSHPDNPLSELYRPLRRRIDRATYTLRYPTGDKPNSIKDSEWAIRQSFYGSVMDVSLSAFRGWDRQVLRYPQRNSNEIIMQPHYHRITQFGVDVAIPEGERVWRGEVAYLPDRGFIDRHDTATEREQWLALAGVDWQLSGSWMITAQYFVNSVANAEALARDGTESALTLSLDKKLLRE